MAATCSRTPVFVTQLHRASAQRGRLDPVFQDLSDHWTQILQRLYPVWALIGPGLSDPGHIEIHSRTIYLDSDELLCPRAQIAAGTLEPRAIVRCFGVALDETLRAVHTKRWAVERDVALAGSSDPAERQLAADRRLLEEPQMEAHGVRGFAADSVRGPFVRRALEAAVTDVILPRFTDEVLHSALAGRPLSRDTAGRATVYLQARTHYGIVDPGALGVLDAIWLHTLGACDLAALEDLFARLIWIGDGELDALDRAARAYRDIIGAADPPPTGEDEGDGASGGGGGRPEPAPDGADRERQMPGVGSLADALEHALAHARAGQLEQLDEDIELKQLLESARQPRDPASGRRGHGTGPPSGRIPDRSVDRPPYPDEIQRARRYATRLRHAITHGTRQLDKRTPGGRFDGRAYARGQAQRAAGRPVSAHPWHVTRQLRAPIEAPHVGLIIDTSGSMHAYEYALGPIAWIITDALRQIDGRCASALFGNGAELLADGSAPLALVPGIATGGGTAFAGDAIELVCEHLEMTNPRRPRLLYVLSDGGWTDTQTGVKKIRWLAEHTVPTIHLSIGIAPLAVQCDRITVITDPADALDQIAADTVAALGAAGRRRT